MKRTLRPISFLPPLVLLASLAQARGRPTYDAYYGGNEKPSRHARALAAKAARGPSLPKASARAPAVVSAVDPKRGVPSLLWARKGAPEARDGGDTPEAAARAYLGRYAGLYEVSPADVAAARVAHVHDTGRGPRIVTLRQRVGDVDVFRSDVKVLLAREGNALLAIAGSPHAAASRAAALGGPGAGFALGREEALARAFGDRFGMSVDAAAFRDTGRRQGAYRHYGVEPSAFGLYAASMRAAPRVKQVYFALPDGLVPAYYLELEASSRGDDDAYAYVVAADDGRLLYRASITARDAFTYKVFADDDWQRNYPPTDGPLADVTPYPGDLSPENELRPSFATQIDVTTVGFNKNCDPWLAPGATITSGNNVDAYADHDEEPGETPEGPPVNDGNDPPEGGVPGDADPSNDPTAGLTSPKAFAYAYDPSLEPAATPGQVKAAVTQLFYLNNWMHDYWYDSGFDEASGVAQNSNFGRVKDEEGNVVTDGENDAIEAQAQDKLFAGSRDNANMSTPADGGKPTMQMYLFNGRLISADASTTAAGLPELSGYEGASFGPTKFDVTGPAALVDDGVSGAPLEPDGPPGTTTDACEPIASAPLAGKIALVDRGRCDFHVKISNAQKAGAAGVVVITDARPPTPMGGLPAEPVTIPAIMVTQADGAALKAALATTFNVTLKRSAEVDYDGTIDNLISAHEWGHYLHHRLVSCGSQQCDGMSEGWADVNALLLSVKAGDDMNGSFAAASFATSASKDASYFGIRRYPYSKNRAKNPLSFKHIAVKNALPFGPSAPPVNPAFVAPDPENPGGPPLVAIPNSESHNAGEVWAAVFFDAYANLLSSHPFDEAKRRMADYVVGGMKLAPPEPTFTEQRDAVLAYVYHSDSADYQHFVDAFVGRGMGVGAVSPPLFGGALVDPEDPESEFSFDEAVENDVAKGELAFAGAELEEAVRSCDGDGVVDADETGQLVVRVDNVGMRRVDAAKVQVSTAALGVTFPGGGAADVAAVDPYGNLTVRVDARLAGDAPALGEIAFALKVDSETTFTASVNGSLLRRTNYDELEKSTTIDRVEASATPWAGGQNEITGGGGETIWARAADPKSAKVNHVWHGDDAGAPSDASNESPDIVVPPAGKLVITFNHRYSFEADPADAPERIFYDGGVVEYAEVTGSGGALEWQDVTKIAALAPAYNATLGADFDESGDAGPGENPLLGRQGFGGTSANYPAMGLSKINFGTALAGKTVRVRFRVASDASAGDLGWDVDDIRVVGSSNTPFPSLVADQGDCSGVPAADAGEDQSVAPGAAVTLDASGSTDPADKALSYAWQQLEGPPVELQSGDGARPTFVAPSSKEGSTLVFRVKVTNGAPGFGGDTVAVQVAPDASAGAGGSGGSGGSGMVCNPPPAGNGGGAGASGGAGRSGNPGSAGNVGVPGDDDDGCGCSTVGSPASRGAWLSALAAGLALVRRRRRKPGQ